MSGTASAPASSANLGPGFDFLALALELRCVVTVKPAEEWKVAREARSIVDSVIGSLGLEGPYAVEIESAIPIGRGLGSSAALAVATGGAALRAGGQDIDHKALFRAAAASDGHPDNAAAAVYGGLVAVAGSDVRRLELSPQLIPVIAIPNATLTTSEAREALPKTMSHAAAARSAARAAFLVEGLRTADPTALAAAAGDELHENPRTSLSPFTAALADAAKRAGALHASWSGAGPSVIALGTSETVETIADALRDALGDEGMVVAPKIADEGVS